MMQSGLSLPRIETPGECTLLLRFGERIDASCNDRVHAAARALRAPAIPGLLELVPAYASLAVHYDPTSWHDGNAGRTAIDRFVEVITERLSSMNAGESRDESRLVDIPVCYDREFGLDLDDAANQLGLNVDELIERHCAASYRVAMLGFAPGFPYLLGLDRSLHLPRRSQPRQRVPAGSVAIGGAQTGIYPSELPGGWQLIGRTPLRLFDIERHPPQWLDAGDRVRFIAIDRHRFDALSGNRA